MQIPPGEDPTAVAEHHHEQVHLDLLFADPHVHQAPVRLRLRSRRRLEPHRRRLRPRLHPKIPHVSLHRHVRSLVPCLAKLPMQHHRVVAHLRKSRLDPLLERVQIRSSRRPRLGLPRRFAPLAHRLHVDAHLPRDRLVPHPRRSHLPDRLGHPLFDQFILRDSFRCRRQDLRSCLFLHDFPLALSVFEGGKLADRMGGI